MFLLAMSAVLVEISRCILEQRAARRVLVKARCNLGFRDLEREMRIELNSSIFYMRSQVRVAQCGLDSAKVTSPSALANQKHLLFQGFGDSANAKLA